MRQQLNKVMLLYFTLFVFRYFHSICFFLFFLFHFCSAILVFFFSPVGTPSSERALTTIAFVPTHKCMFALYNMHFSVHGSPASARRRTFCLYADLQIVCVQYYYYWHTLRMLCVFVPSGGLLCAAHLWHIAVPLSARFIITISKPKHIVIIIEFSGFGWNLASANTYTMCVFVWTWKRFAKKIAFAN